MTVSEEEVSRGISLFRKSSAGGPDGLGPQHLKDMVSVASNSQVLLPALTAFVQLVLEGRTPTFIRPYFFGANLTAIRKSDGGVRPIDVGCTLRCLVAKVAGRKIMEEMGELLAPRPSPPTFRYFRPFGTPPVLSLHTPHEYTAPVRAVLFLPRRQHFGRKCGGSEP